MDPVLPRALVQAHKHLSLAIQENIPRGALWHSQEIQEAGRAFAYAFAQEPAWRAEFERRARLVESLTAPDTPFDRAKCQALQALTCLPRSCFPRVRRSRQPESCRRSKKSGPNSTQVAVASDAYWRLVDTFRVPYGDLSEELARWGREYRKYRTRLYRKRPGEVQPPPGPTFTMTRQLKQVRDALVTLLTLEALPDQARAVFEDLEAQCDSIINDATHVSANGCLLIWLLLAGGPVLESLLGGMKEAADQLVEWAQRQPSVPGGTSPTVVSPETTPPADPNQPGGGKASGSKLATGGRRPEWDDLWKLIEKTKDDKGMTDEKRASLYRQKYSRRKKGHLEKVTAEKVRQVRDNYKRRSQREQNH